MNVKVNDTRTVGVKAAPMGGRCLLVLSSRSLRVASRTKVNVLRLIQGSYGIDTP